MNLKVLAIIILAVIYLYNLLLSVIHMRSAGSPIPANAADVYDRETC